MVHGIVKGHHGFCLVESELGKGSSFTIYLPIPSGPGPHPVLANGMIPEFPEHRQRQVHLSA